jgi:hypothetical protein
MLHDEAHHVAISFSVDQLKLGNWALFDHLIKVCDWICSAEKRGRKFGPDCRSKMGYHQISRRDDTITSC